MNERRPAKGFTPDQVPVGGKGGAAGKIGVLLVNLGTPDGTDYWSVRRYLKEFLSDRRVIETNRALWWVILNFIVLTVRPSRSGAKYRSVWNKERDEFPLRTITRTQGEKVAAALAARSDLVVDWAMRYGNPSIASRIEALREKGCDRLLVFPLYPQYSASTTATVNDKAFDTLEADALSTCGPHGARLSRRSRLYRGVGPLHQVACCGARLGAGGDPRLLSWAPPELRGQG